jgi:hypothetical protein
VTEINCGSQLLNGSHSWKLGPIEAAMSLSLPAGPAPQRPPYRFAPDPVSTNKTQVAPRCRYFGLRLVPLFKNSKFRMIFVALIPVMIYYA